MESVLLDAAGHHRSPATMPGYHRGRPPREVGMDRWAWEQLEPWLEIRRELPIGAVLCVIHGPTAGRRREASAARKRLHRAAAATGVRRRFAPHQLRHAHAVEMAHEGVRSSSSSASSDTPTWASPASTCKASTVRRSSAPSTDARRRRSPPTPACRSGGNAAKHRVGRLVLTDPPHLRLANLRCVGPMAQRPPASAEQVSSTVAVARKMVRVLTADPRVSAAVSFRGPWIIRGAARS